MNKVLKLLTALLLPFNGFTQDNIDIVKMMHYNLLNYRNTTTQCDGTTNPPSDKDAALKTILNSVKPDLITLNEIGSNPVNASRLLTNAFVVDGMDYEFFYGSNQAQSSIVNLLFINKKKLLFYTQTAISKGLNNGLLVRDIDIITLFYNDPIGLSKGDTIFINVAIAHLKAGSTQADKDERARQTEALMDYLDKNKLNAQNWVMSGDFNIGTSTENCYQNLTAHSNVSIRFYDPIDSPGSWNNNANFSNIHTQSTRTSATNGGCFSGGGMDDRFDFILCSKEVMNNQLHAGYIKNSYKALGQDGLRFNSTINSPANNSVNADIATALYNLSDHLPVLMDMSFRKWVAGKRDEANAFECLIENNDLLSVQLRGKNLLPFTVVLTDLSGKEITNNISDGTASNQTVQLPKPLVPGIYLINIYNTTNGSICKKVAIR